jgi:2-(1,2-epoxy-1,2-dihydrophenyl)acetyl-CoA isomerase
MTGDADGLVLSSVENGVGYIALNRTDAMNAFSLDMAKAFMEALEDHAGDGDVGAIVVRGEGKIFSAGGDVKAMLEDVRKGEDRAAYFREPLAAFGDMALKVRGCPKPVVAAVHGAVAGAAFNFMLSCDIIVAREGTRFNQAFVSVGVSPDCGGTYYLPRLVGYARACELTMLPTQLTAEQALEWGLVNRVVPADSFDDEVRKVAEQLASGPTLALGRTKALLNDAFGRTPKEAMEAERLAQIGNSVGADFEEGLTAFAEKRKPEFRDR